MFTGIGVYFSVLSPCRFFFVFFWSPLFFLALSPLVRSHLSA